MRGILRKIRDQALLQLHRGGRFECPACGVKLRRFLTGGERFRVLSEKKVAGAGWRENNICPNCWSTDRERLMLAFLKGSPSLLPDGGVVLHVAPEPSLCRYFAEHTGVFHVRGDYLRPGMTLRLDLQSLPFQDACADLVICNHVLEHVDDDARAMAEIRRVMKPDGRAILQVPIALTEGATDEDPSITDKREREQRFGQDDHVRLYGRDYAQRLKRAGFRLDMIDWRSRPDIFGASPERSGLNPDEILYLVRRSD